MPKKTQRLIKKKFVRREQFSNPSCSTDRRAHNEVKSLKRVLNARKTLNHRQWGAARAIGTARKCFVHSRDTNVRLVILMEMFSLSVRYSRWIFWKLLSRWDTALTENSNMSTNPKIFIALSFRLRRSLLSLVFSRSTIYRGLFTLLARRLHRNSLADSSQLSLCWSSFFCASSLRACITFYVFSN